MWTHACVGRCALVAAAVWSAALWVAGICGNPFPLAFGHEPVSPRIAAGRQFFVQKWEIKPARPFESDGLGPVYNAVSCVACHRQGGVGGGGPAENDVELATRVGGGGNPTRDRFAALLQATGSSTTLLHAFGTNRGYEGWRAHVLSPPLPDDKEMATLISARRARERKRPVSWVSHKDYQLRISRRNTPALFGLGLIDAIPDEVLIAEADRQKAASPETAGRIASSNPEFENPLAPAGDPTVRVGKFGWRGQIGSLREFVLAACSNELGLETPGHAQPLDPLDDKLLSPSNAPRPRAGSVEERSREQALDITEEQCLELTTYVAELPRPRKLLPRDQQLVSPIHQGEFLFEQIGCASCHVKKLGQVDGLYSDLLLHVMGTDLGDPVPANPPVPPGTVVRAASNYYGGSVQFAEMRPKLEREWRTPPLWGVRDSAPYLHDGRAATLVMAIDMHGGQGHASRHAFQRLPATDQDRVLAFLNSLAAPAGAERLASK